MGDYNLQIAQHRTTRNKKKKKKKEPGFVVGWVVKLTVVAYKVVFVLVANKSFSIINKILICLLACSFRDPTDVSLFASLALLSLFWPTCSHVYVTDRWLGIQGTGSG